MDTRFHCAYKLRKIIAKNRRHLEDRCDAVRKVLKLNPLHGVVVKGFPGLRKMRVYVPGLAIGSRGGYRLIYRQKTMDQTMHIALLTIYYKGDTEDLNHFEYEDLDELGDQILSTPIDYDWTDE